MSRLFLLRFSFLSIKNLVNTKLNLLVNLSIFVIIFALTASFISILFENRIEQLETKVTQNEVNQILYTKWLNRTPKIISQIDNVYQSRKDETLFSMIVTGLPDDDDDETSQIYSMREQFHNYYYFLSDIAQINFQNIDLALTDAILLSNSNEDIESVERQKILFRNLIIEFDRNSQERLVYRESHDFKEGWNKTQLHYKGYSVFVDKKIEIIQKQKDFFLNFGTEFFSKKRKSYSNDNITNLQEIKDFAKLETRFIFFAFVIQFVIFIVLQIFEITIERDRKNEKN